MNLTQRFYAGLGVRLTLLHEIIVFHGETIVFVHIWSQVAKQQHQQPLWVKDGDKKLPAPSIPRRSPSQVLTRPHQSWLSRSDEIGHIQGGMAVSHCHCHPQPFYTCNNSTNKSAGCVLLEMYVPVLTLWRWRCQ